MIRSGIRALVLVAAAGCAAADHAAGTASVGAPGDDHSASSATYGTTTRTVAIPVRDGVTLEAKLVAPDAAGPFPALVFPSSWAGDSTEYDSQTAKFGAAGYVVLSYAPRGWGTSGGGIDVAGPKDVADITDVIDWVIANTPADPARIGMGGISYGGGLSLLGGAMDPRVRAIGAMSAWTDLTFSLYAQRTRHLQVSAFLYLSALAIGNPSSELEGIIVDFFADMPAMVAYVKDRGAGSYLPQVNANQPAVLMANAWSDSVFEGNQLVDFFGKLTGPKRLEFRPGDHAIPETTGLLGLDNDVWTSVHRWFDHYLKGEANGIDAEPAVHVERFQGGYEDYASWSAMAAGATTFGLGGKVKALDRGDLVANGKPAAWSWKITAWPTDASGGIALVSNGLAALTGKPPTVDNADLDRGHAGVWMTPESGLASPLQLRGAAHLHVTVTSSSVPSTIVAYLYDADPATGTAGLITHAPFTITDAAEGAPVAVDLEFPVNAYDIPAGHQVELVIDTSDLLYADFASLLSTVAFSSPAADPSYLRLPTR